MDIRLGAIHSRTKTTIQGRGTKRRPDLEVIDGEEIYRRTNEMQRLTRVFDRTTNRYLERITNAGGEVIRHTDEPLTEHREHGSAKPKKEAAE